MLAELKKNVADQAAALAAHPGTLPSKMTLVNGQKIVSPNKRYELVMQADGNLVLYDNIPSRHSFWASNTAGKSPSARLVMQDDGNLVVYGINNRVLWHAASMGNPGAYLVIQDDGNAVVYDQAGQKSLFSTRQSNYDRAGGFTKWVGNAAKSVGGAVGDAVSAVSNIPVLGFVIDEVASFVPGVGPVVTAVGQAAQVGAQVVKIDPVLTAAAQVVPQGQTGFNAGVQIMREPQAGSKEIIAARETLGPDDKKGYDLAVSTQIGRKDEVAPSYMTPAQKAGWYATHGMRGAHETQKTTMMTHIIQHPEMKNGAQAAADKIQAQRSTWWHKFLVMIHLAKK